MTSKIKVPQLPESITDATILAWHKKAGDPVMRDESILDLETDKVVLEVPAPDDGVMGEIIQQQGAVVKEGDILAIFNEGVQSTAKPGATVQAEPSQINTTLSPSVRHLVKELNIDTTQIQGSGKDGRILKSDIMAWLDQQEQTVKPPTPQPVIEEMERPQQRVAMTRLRAKIAERLVEAQQTAAILTTFNEVNLQNIIDLRTKYKDLFNKTHDSKLGFMSFFVRASIEALKQFPTINASIDGQDVLYHGYYDIGIAVGSPRGLVVPVLRDADQWSFAEIENNIREYGQKAQNGSLTYAELQGGTFTISNGGVYGSMLSTPILNPPQSAILGMHNIIQRPIAEDGEVVIRPMMYLALSYDHRIVDGKEAVQFLVTIKNLLEDPARILLNI